jgi:hypothetical protein
MTAGRLYCIQSWNNASETSGEQIGNRLAQSRGLHFNRDGTANTFLYSEENNEKKPTKVPLKQRILPQSARVEKLLSEAIELEQAFKAGEFSPEEYTLLREVAFKKLRRAEELLKKAITPIKTGEEYEVVGVETTYSSSDVDYTHTEVATPCGVSWIDDLSPSNSFKSFLKMSCKVVKTSIEWHQKARNYINELKAA